jgi:hypothetical protein
MRSEGTVRADQHGARRAAAVGVLESAATGSDELQTRRIRLVQRRILVVLVLTQILGGAGVGAGVAIAALSATWLSGSDVVGGLALMCTAVGAALTAASTARIAVRAGRRSALLVGYLSAAVGAVAAAVAVEIRTTRGVPIRGHLARQDRPPKGGRAYAEVLVIVGHKRSS